MDEEITQPEDEEIIVERLPYYFYREDGLVFMAGAMNPDDAAESAKGNGCSFAEGVARPGLDYVDAGELMPRPQMQIRVDGLTLSGVPFPSELSIDRRAFYPVDDSVVELAFDRPGPFLVGVRCPPYLDWEVDIANPA